MSAPRPFWRAHAASGPSALSADGFAASARPSPGSAHGEQICQHHCPVAHVAAEFPQLCERLVDYSLEDWDRRTRV